MTPHKNPIRIIKDYFPNNYQETNTDFLIVQRQIVQILKNSVNHLNSFLLNNTKPPHDTKKYRTENSNIKKQLNEIESLLYKIDNIR